MCRSDIGRMSGVSVLAGLLSSQSLGMLRQHAVDTVGEFVNDDGARIKHAGLTPS